MNSSSCLFCNIVNQSVKSFVIWEDDSYIAFLTPFPNTKGFSVVIPKQHYSSYIFEAPDEIMTGLMHAAKKVAQLLETGLKVKRCAVVFEGFGINHLHAKLIPLHGIEQDEWRAINSPEKMTIFFEKYQGYISSHDSNMWSDEQLLEVLKEIQGK